MGWSTSSGPLIGIPEASAFSTGFACRGSSRLGDAVGVLGADVVGGDQLGEDAEADQLGPDAQQRRRVDQERPVADRSVRRVQPEDRQVEHAQAAEDEQHQADRPQDVERTLAEPGQEPDGHQVEEPLDEPRDPVLRRAESPGAVVDLDLADPEPSGVSQDRDEPVQLAVDADLARGPRRGRP